MSSQNSNQKYTKSQIPEVLLPTVIPLVIPNSVLHEIKYLCKNIAKVEWSGILFYTIEGSIKKPETFKITIKTILPLDMGTAVFTSYDLDSRFIDFLEEDFDVRSQWKVGHIHSHNTMGVYFSSTDKEELHDNAPGHDFYVSLIVNNFMDFCAKVAFTGAAKMEIKNVPFNALDENGKPYVIQTSDYEINDDKLFIYDCKVQSNAEQLKVNKSFATQTAEIMKPKPPVKKEVVKYKPFNPFSDNIKTPQQEKLELEKEAKEYNQTFQNHNFSFDDEDIEDAEIAEGMELLYLLVKKTFSVDDKMSDKELEDMCIQETVELILSMELTPYAIAMAVIDKYPIVFKEMFPKAEPADFIMVTYDFLEVLEAELYQYEELKLTLKLLTTMIEKFIENDRTASKV